ncbi:MAG: Gfo/Idh/MocA family oxidoreductase [Gemmatimonadota bacterium]|nr:Gfo/Idh/MocA family oxidoreductase [Gemmatimonadota bacterium]
MEKKISRKDFFQIGSAAALGLSAAVTSLPEKSFASESEVVRIGLVGTGGRGRGLLATLLAMEGVRFPALCDINRESLSKAQGLVEKAGLGRPEGYPDGPEDFKRMMDRDDLDAVIIASPWHWHTPMAVYAMKAGKYAGVEVPSSITLEECWDLVETHEETGVPCMMLENWSFRRDNLAVLNMIRKGLLGEIVHCHCAHSHDCIDHWFFDPQGNMRWGGEYLVRRNADQYPTHSLGPVLSWMDLGCGDYFRYLTSTANRSLGINHYFATKFGPDHPNAKRKYAQGDIVTTVVKTIKGNTIVINYDMQLPRPYDNRWMIQGTEGIYNEQRNAVYIKSMSPEYHQWEPFDPYQEKYEHSWWKAMKDSSGTFGHGGTDYLQLQQFVKAVREKTQTPIDVYDSVLMSCIVPLSEKSIAADSAPVECPDFTRGRWRTSKPAFAVES